MVFKKKEEHDCKGDVSMCGYGCVYKWYPNYDSKLSIFKR